MKRVMVVYNPRSSQFGRVREEVLSEANKLKGWMVGKFEVLDTDVDHNASRLAKVLNDGDLVVAAGGDGTATIAMNGIMTSKAEDVKFGVLGYGNFNDMARTFGTKSMEEIIMIAEGKGEGKIKEAWGLECFVNDRHYRWGMCYFTIGLFAEACAVFDQKDNRRQLRTGKKSLFYSIWLLAKWYMKNRKKHFLPNFTLERKEDQRECKDMTDYVAMNGTSMARVMKGKKWLFEKESFSGVARSLRSLWKLGKLMAPSIFTKVPGKETNGDILDFNREGTVMIQAEGEYTKIRGVKKIEIRKAQRSIKVVAGKGV